MTMTSYLVAAYVGGVVLRAVLCHGLLQNPNCTQTSIEVQMFGCLTWPIQLILKLFKRR